jgi:hypothetical protein
MPTKKDLAGLQSETPQQPLRRGRGLRLSRASKQASQPASKPADPPEPVPPRPPSQPAAEAAPVAPPKTIEAAPSAGSNEVKAASTTQPDAAEAAESKAAEVVSSPGALAGEPGQALAPPELGSPSPERKQRKLLLRKDLVKLCKRIARAQDRKLYQVVESALEEYIQRYGAHE